jgi:saccharopine dehydrogenase-like NADP-dependent oxidoreductase
MSERVAVLLGCGMVGTEVARLLAADETFDCILVADKDAIRAHRIAKAVGAKITAIQVDGYDEAAVAHLARGASVVLNTTGPFTPQIRATMRGALLAGVPYADINDEAEVLYELFESGEFDAAARQRGVPLVVGLGTSPGLTNIWARHLADQLDAVTAFHIAIVMDPRYRNPTVFRHRFSVHGGQVVVFRDHGWQWLPGFTEPESILFPEPVGDVCVHLVGHCEPVTLPRFFKGLQTVDVKAGFSVDTVNRLLHDVIRYGLGTPESIRVGAIDIVPAEFTAAFLSSPATDHLFQREPLPSQIARQVQAKGRKGDRPYTLTMQVMMDAGVRVIAMPLAVTARLLTRGEVPLTGLLAPEVLDPRPFLEVLERWGVRLHLRHEEATDRFPSG